MSDQYPVSPDFAPITPLDDGDLAILGAIAGLEPGTRGDRDSNLIIREPARRAIGTFGEVVVARVMNELGRQEVAFIDIQPRGILAGIDFREPGVRESGEKLVALPAPLSGSDSPESQAIKLEAARRITRANEAVEN